MTTKLVKSSRNVFIDTDTLTNESSAKAHILFPAHPFSVCCGDTIRISLQQFVMPRRIYNINVTNKVFYVRDTAADTYTEIVIAEGVYDAFTTLATAIQTALRAHTALAGVTCTYDAVTRRFTFGSLPTNNIIVCWQSRATRPNGVSATGFFQQTHEILGGRPSRGAAPVDALSGGTTAPYPASLASIHSLYPTRGPRVCALAPAPVVSPAPGVSLSCRGVLGRGRAGLSLCVRAPLPFLHPYDRSSMDAQAGSPSTRTTRAPRNQGIEIHRKPAGIMYNTY